MRAYPATGQAWFGAAFQGIVFAVWWSVWSMVGDHISWQKALIEGVVIAPLYALLMWFSSRRERRADATILGAMTADQRREVRQAASTGTPPDDRALRPAAAAMVRSRLLAYHRHQRFTLVVFAGFLAVSALLAITDGLGYLAGAALFGGALVWALRYPGQLNRKLATLEAATPPPPPPGKSRLH